MSTRCSTTPRPGGKQFPKIFGPARISLYHLLANDQSTYVAYVSEQNLLPDETGQPVGHPHAALIFDKFEPGRYQLRPRNRTERTRRVPRIPREFASLSRYGPDQAGSCKSPDATGVIDQAWDLYSAAEHAVWDTLYERQAALLQGRACDPFLRGLDALDLHRGGVPNLARLNHDLAALTAGRMLAVPGLVPDTIYSITWLIVASAGRFIRSVDSLDYLQEPECSMICSGMRRCWPIRYSPTTCRPMAREGCGRCISTTCTILPGSTGTRSSSA